MSKFLLHCAVKLEIDSILAARHGMAQWNVLLTQPISLQQQAITRIPNFSCVSMCYSTNGQACTSGMHLIKRNTQLPVLLAEMFHQAE